MAGPTTTEGVLLNNTYNTIAPVDQAATTTSKSHWRQSKGRKGLLALGASAMALTFAAPAFAADPPAAAPASTVAEVVVNGVPFKETVLPTRLNLDSGYGLKLNVMDTPRNTTLISTTQLETLNIEDPRAFSYLTSSSYSDSSFGTPNIPRIRGQYSDVYFNGMRYSFSQNGYGVPVNYDSLQNVSITKGPANVTDGPGPGVGGEVNFLTKRPNMTSFTFSGQASADTIGNNRLNVTASGPITPGTLGLLLDFSGEDSNNTYFSTHYFHKAALYAALRWQPNDKYRLDFNTEINDETYTEEVGVNRVNQNLIDNHQYLQGGPVNGTAGSDLYCQFAFVCGLPTGSAAGTGTPYAAVPFLTEVQLAGTVKLNPKTTIDETPGVITKGLLYNAQLIQTYTFNSNLSLENNAFFAWQDSYNSEPYYYSDSSDGSYTFEDRMDLNGNYPISFGGVTIDNQFVVGGSFRFAHVNYNSNFSTETVSVYDLTANPSLWVFPAIYQGYADNFQYKGPLGSTLYGTPGRDIVNGGDSGDSDLYDTGIFFQDRMQFSKAWSALFGARIDAVQAHSFDPLGGAVCDFCFTGTYTSGGADPLPQSHTTGIFGLAQVNGSLVYTPSSWLSTYATIDWVQSVNPNGGEQGVNAFLQVPDSELLRQNSYLYELGAKLNLFNNKLFVGSAVFDQKRGIPTGPGGTQTTAADIKGVEIEGNYQPNRNFYATASYSYIQTTLKKAPVFYDYPAQPGLNVDGAASAITFFPGQTFKDPGVPEHVFNFLGNYKFGNGLGVRTGVQVTGPIATTPSGRVDVANSTYGGIIPLSALPASVVATGYYSSPVIPWQFTWNAAVFYEWDKYTVTLSVYNLTDQRNWSPSPNEYGNDFLVLSDPRTFELRVAAKF
jgi:hypothetical protein